jgi:hypothetical protein
MNQETFDAILERRIEKIRSVLASKAKEYAKGDRLHNFKRAAKFTGDSPAKMCASFMMKHMVSIMDIVDDVKEIGPLPSREMVDEKIGDAINYLILLEALLIEVAEWPQNSTKEIPF